MNNKKHLFDQLREYLQTAPILCYPDPQLQYIVDTDASATGVGAVLSQKKGDKENVVAYYSKTLNTAEKNYCVIRRELLAVIKAVKHFRPFCTDRSFD